MNPVTCRLCGEETINYVSIFEENDHWIAEKISRCLPIIVLSTDNLPNNICNRCLYVLNASYTFVTKSINVDTMLRQQRFIKIESGKVKKTRITLTDLKRKAMAGPVDCELCDKKFEDLDLFDEHIETLHMQPWKCNSCDKSFEKSVQLITHKSLDHDGQIIICNNCTTVSSKTHIGPSDIHAYSRPPLKINNDKNKDKSKFALFCDVCKIGFGDKRYFTGHNKIHDAVTTNCTTCQVECDSIYDLFLHKRDSHNMYKKVQLKYVCEQCGKFFTNSWQWETHRATACPKKLAENSCKYCDASFTTNYKLTRHLRRHKTEMFNDPTATVYRCVACPKIFVDKEFYEKHRNVHDPECWDKFKCDSCNRSFRDNVRLKEHEKSIHQGIKPHQCDLCERTFHRLSNLRAHRQVHVGRKCTVCGETYKKLKDFMNHMKQQHPNDIDPATKSLIRRSHRRTNGTYICRYCGKKLSSYKSVLDHEHIHTGDKPYTCKICHKSFSSYSARWTHEHRHEKGNFICEHCGKCFSYKQNLSIHIKTHGTMQERKHACPTCEKRFLRKCHLNIHMRIHNGIRPYTCDICSFSFTQKGDMRRHRLRHNKVQSNRKNTRRAVNRDQPL